MRKRLVLPMAAFLVAGLAWSGHAAEHGRHDRYDRYERGSRAEPAPPPPRAAAPARQRHAQHGEPYFFGHVGAYDPNADGDGLRGYDSGFAFGLGVGSRVSPIFAVEGAFGAFSAEAAGDEVSVVPLTIGARFIIPNPFIEPYIGAGLGIYFSSIDDLVLEIDDDSTDFGGYMSLGMDFWLNPRVALNFEGKYHWVDAEYTDVSGFGRDVNLGGWTVNFGVRVSF